MHMELDAALAQQIVDKTVCFTDFVINIMDSTAKIIASDNPERIGEFHYGAFMVLKTRKNHIMTPQSARKYKNVIPGISMPLKFRGEIVGVIGIGAGPSIEYKYCEILQYTTELLLEQAFLKEELLLENKARDNFLQEIIMGNYKNGTADLVFKSQMFKFNLEQPYAVIVLKHNSRYLSSLKGYDANPSIIQNMENELRQLVLSCLADYHGVLCTNLSAHLVVIVPYTEAKNQFSETFTGNIATKIYNSFTVNQRFTTRISIGGIAPSLKDINLSFKQAISAFDIAQRFHIEQPIVSFKQLSTEYIALQINGDLRNQYCQSILGEILEPGNLTDNMWFTTLIAYFQNNMGIKKTAETLFVHRNTLLFRLKRIYEMTGLNPQVMSDAVQLYMAILFYRADHKAPQDQ